MSSSTTVTLELGHHSGLVPAPPLGAAIPGSQTWFKHFNFSSPSRKNVAEDRNKQLLVHFDDVIIGVPDWPRDGSQTIND